MQQYAYMLRLVRPTFISDATAEERAIVSEHFEHLKRLFAEGIMIHVGRATDGSFGLAIFNAPDDDAATTLMQRDPVVVKGVMTATLYPYRVVLHGH